MDRDSDAISRRALIAGALRGVAAALILALATGCIAAPASATPPGAIPPSPTLSAPTPASHIPTPPATSTPTAAVGCAERTLASLSGSQRIGQLFMLGLIDNRLDADTRAAIARFHFGSVWFTAKTSVGVAGVRAVANAAQAQATRAATNGVRFFIAANQEGGRVQALSGAGFETIPSALTQGTLTPAVLRERAARWGRQLRDAGVNFNFAPVADVVPRGSEAQNAPIGQLQREFGHDPATVSSHVAAFIAGMRTAGIATSAKHFPGLGRVVGNTDFTSAVRDSVTTRNDAFLQPFRTAIEADVPFVMVSEATYTRIDPARLAVFSPVVIDGTLRGDLGYRGVVISDDMGGAIAVESIPPASRALDFLNAGGDMIISKNLAPAIEMAQALANRASESAAFKRRVDEAALSVLRAKESAGLLPCG